MSYTFNSELFFDKTLPIFKEEVIKEEPMFFSASYEYVRLFGGEISQAFLNNLPIEWKQKCIIDSRVHMLMPGWFPCIPGYHHDDVPRGTNGQPDYDNPAYHSKHVLALVNGDICPTEFAVGETTFPKIEEDKKIYKEWHPLVEYKIKKGELSKVIAPSNTMLYFDWQSWHQGTKAIKNGWRWFMRASINTNRPIKNEIRRQVQVYLENPMEG